jgi:hypothetical protein
MPPIARGVAPGFHRASSGTGLASSPTGDSATSVRNGERSAPRSKGIAGDQPRRATPLVFA